MRFAAARGYGQVIIMKNHTELPIEINAERLMQLPAGSYLAADMRDEYSCGYGSWALEQSRRAAAGEERRNEIEKALRKTFRHDLIGRFEKAVVQYNLVEEGDRIAICISGGKDSMLMAKLFQELKRHNKFPFELFFVCMDPGYSPENRGIIENNARLLGIPIEFFETENLKRYTTSKNRPAICAHA